jgi:AraC family transcriptional regulator
MTSSPVKTMLEVQRIVSRPQLTVRHTAAASCEFQPHSHAAFTVTALLAGRFEVSIGDGQYSLQPGQIALTNINQLHSGRAENVEFVSVSLSPITVDEIMSETDGIKAGSEIKVPASVISDPGVYETLGTMAKELDADRIARDQMLDSLARQLLIQLVRSHLTIRRSPLIELSRAGPVDRRLRRALEFMHDNFERELPVEEIAAAAYLSEYHFARLFKQLVGVTPHFYLAGIRLERARKLLLETSLSVSEIAQTVGYQSQSHFTRVFKSVTGLTPLVFRRGQSRP